MSAQFSPNELGDFLAFIEAQMNHMLENVAETREAGEKIWEISLENASRSPDIAWPLWLIWGALTDGAEWGNRPEAEATMRRAAKEWLILSRDNVELQKAYLDRWVYEETGHERKPG